MKIAFIHNDKKIGTGAHYINDLMSSKLSKNGIEVKNFYPRISLIDTPIPLGGIKNILFFYSLLEHRKKILKFNIIQGTTYTALPFLAYSVPVVSHFGSTTRGFLNATPLANSMEDSTRKVWYMLKREGAIKETNVLTRRPMSDIADIEEYVASRATAVIATSENVKRELINAGVLPENIHLIHNGIEDYWFESPQVELAPNPGIVFLGRLGNDAFTLKLKGLDRLIHLYQHFSNTPKSTFCITTNKSLLSWMKSEISNHFMFVNVQKDKLPAMLRPLRGSILFIPSRYEGFSLSLIEGMSQGLIPVIYSVGVAPEIIINGENGFIVSSQSEAIETIEQLLTDPLLRERLSVGAIKTAELFSSEIIAHKLIELYENILLRESNNIKKKKNRKSWCVSKE
ncbi:MAG: glycosyltransferase family 4 protein [Candidatus Pacebacteria bacterium]|nr:glycosyltransferase family 4 protein [Candidatus Paceibacterota bacterium]